MSRNRPRLTSLVETVVLILLFAVTEMFWPSPRPSSSPLVSGIAPADGQNTRPLSKDQLNQLEGWLLLHRDGWRRNVIPPAHPSYMVQVEHWDGTSMLVVLFLRGQSNVYFSKHTKDRRFDAGWLSLPAAEVDGLITMLRQEA